MEAVIVIPARFASSRFPGKPLIDLVGKSLIQRVWERCSLAVSSSKVFVATDDERIRQHCEEHGIQVLMTSESCLTGTDRVYEASVSIKAPIIVNVQGDEPLISPDDILKVINAHRKNPQFVHCGMCPIRSEDDFRSPSVPKVVCREDDRLLYMSRAAIPTDKKLSFRKAMKQVCIYSFSKKALENFARYGRKSSIEAIEDIEILRFFEIGYDIKMVEVSDLSIAVDFPKDVNRVVQAIKNHEGFKS
jgi:3-deoxy-manno-octulosonate cytidylyltransferase (CMP-KDO synthetase)